MTQAWRHFWGPICCPGLFHLTWPPSGDEQKLQKRQQQTRCPGFSLSWRLSFLAPHEAAEIPGVGPSRGGGWGDVPLRTVSSLVRRGQLSPGGACRAVPGPGAGLGGETETMVAVPGGAAVPWAGQTHRWARSASHASASLGEGAGREGVSRSRRLSRLGPERAEGSAVTEPHGGGEGSASGHNAGTGFGRRAIGSEAWQGLRRPCKPRRYRGVRLSVLGLLYRSAQTRRLGTAESTTSALWARGPPCRAPGAALPTPLRGSAPACRPAPSRPPRPSAPFCVPRTVFPLHVCLCAKFTC